MPPLISIDAITAVIVFNISIIVIVFLPRRIRYPRRHCIIRHRWAPL